MSKIGLYGGTFDPVHNGHINLALELKEKHGLDEVWWIPTSRSPMRETSVASSKQRYEMVKLAVDAIEGFSVLDIEINGPSPAYTVDTVKKCADKQPDDQFFLLIAQDAAAQFMQWKEPETIAANATLLIGGRLGGEMADLPETIDKIFVETTLLQISSTQVRDRLKKGLYCGHLVSAKVLDFIYVNQLYFIA